MPLRNILVHVDDSAASASRLDVVSKLAHSHGSRLAGLGKVLDRVRTIIEAGEPAKQILDCAQRENVDLVVLGSRGLSDLKGLLLGSVSHKVSQLAECTWVTVK